MNYLEMGKLSLNEGFFKDIEKTIIDQDDPDYIEKDRERMFKQFQQSDEAKRIKKEVIDWICGHIQIFRSFKPTGLLTPDDEDTYFEIIIDNQSVPAINLKAPDWGTIYSIINPGRFNKNGELPYKFNICEGSFSIDHRTSERNSEELRSFKNFPNTILDSCHVRGDEYRPNRNKIYLPENLATLPAGFRVGQNLQIQYMGLTSLMGMPDNIMVGREFNLCHNELKDLSGWNPTFKFGQCTHLGTLGATVTKLDLSDNYITSIADLPDGFSCDLLDLEHCDIEDGRAFPKNLNVNQLYLTKNKLTTNNLFEHPFPRDMKVETLTIGEQRPERGPNWNRYLAKDADMPIIVPAGVKNITIWDTLGTGDPSEDRFDYYGRPIVKQLSESALNEGIFKDIEQTIIDQDDPDYVEKDRERAFNNFKENESRRKKSVIEDWVLEHITHSSFYSGVEKNLSELPYKSYEIDDNYEIHLYSEGAINVPSLTDAFRISVTDSSVIPYKIAECTANLTILKNSIKDPDIESSSLESLKNLPDTLSLSLTVGAPNLKSLDGCPKVIGEDFDISNCSEISSLAGGPEWVGGYVDCSHCNLKNLKGCPRHVGKQFFANYNNINDLTWYPEEFFGPFNIEENALTAEQLKDFTRKHPWIRMSEHFYNQDQAKVYAAGH